MANNFNKSNCIYGGQYSKIFLENDNFECFKGYSELDAANNRPYYVIKNVRNIKRSNPKDCQLIGKETYKYLFTKNEIIAGTVWYCD